LTFLTGMYSVTCLLRFRFSKLTLFRTPK